MGRLDAIWTKRCRRSPMGPAVEARLVEGCGIEGNTDQRGKRQVTIIESERWTELCGELGLELDPSTRRANLLVSGVRLRGREVRGRELRVGEALLEIRGETRPCERMEEAQPGLCASPKPSPRFRRSSPREGDR